MNLSKLTKKQDFQIHESLDFIGWGTVIRTQECRSQSPMPYRLAIPQYILIFSHEPLYLPTTRLWLAVYLDCTSGFAFEQSKQLRNTPI